LISNQIPNPHVVFLITNGDREMSRKVVPLEQGSTFLTFDRGGENVIHAFVVFGYEARRMKAYARDVDLWDQWSGTYYTSAVRSKCEQLVFTGTSVSVNVDGELFAKPINPQVAYFVNLWHEKKLDDQCHFRRRLIFLLTIKWIPLMIYALLMTMWKGGVAVICASVGMTKINWKAIGRPFYYDGLSYVMNDADDSMRGNYLNVKWLGGAYTPGGATPWVWPFAPLLTLIIYPAIATGAVLAGATGENGELISWFEMYFGAFQFTLFSVVVIVAMCIAFGIAVGIFTALKESGIWDKTHDFLTTRISPIRWLASKFEKKPLTEEEKELIRVRSSYRPQHVICPTEVTDGTQKKFVAPPPQSKAQSLALLFETAKSKVCKPFPK
jgi:hypothetical protein